MKKLLLTALLGIGLGTSVDAKAWRGIVPLHSTRADVERLLGKPNGKYGRYELENEWAGISYSTGRCPTPIGSDQCHRGRREWVGHGGLSFPGYILLTPSTSFS